jgi:putative peptide zinc metalloprotease protein
VQGPFILSATRRVVLHATVPGTVDSISVQEGQRVSAGTPLLRMRNLDLESQTAQAQADLTAATDHATWAALRHANFGAAEQERQHFAENNRLSADKLARLGVVSPISGVVVTPHLANLVGRSLDEGDALLELADTSRLQANVYLAEFSMHDVRLDAPVRLLIHGQLSALSGALSLISPASTPIAEGLVPKEQLQGINPPRYYLGIVLLNNDGSLMEGMTGSAKVLADRRSLAGFGFRFARDLVRRKIW